nr:putative LPS assembly protein LptD [Bacteroidales bacterium]
EKIGASYQVSAINRIDFYDSSFSFSTLKWDDFQNGMKHSIPISANYNLFKYINTTFSANYNEYWYTKKAFKYYDFEQAKLDTNTTTGFFTARDFSFNTSASTRIYGIKLFKKGVIRGIRHVLTPSISFQYRPDFGRGVYSYYYNTFMDKNHSNRRLSYFDGALYGGPPDGKVGGVGFNIGNTLQMKVRDRKDTLSGGVRKVNLIDGLSFSTFYNMAVDSFRWSNVAISYRTTLYESINLSGSMSYSPYSINKTTGSMSAITLQKAEGKLLRFERASLAIGGSLPFKKKSTPASTANEEQKLSMGNYMNYADFNIPWSLHLNYNVSLQKYYVVKSQKDTVSINQDLNFSGEVNLTAKWKIGMSSGYDFIAKQLSFTSFDIYRDLHCWEMRLNLIPFGYRRSYNFSLNVKSSVLQDLKLNRRKDFRDYL